MPHPTPLPPRAWLVVGLLWLVGLLNYLDRVMITTMRGSVVEAIPMTDAQFGLLTSVFLWVYAVLSPFAGFLADRFSRSRVIIVSLFAWSVITWLTAHATTFGELLATRALMGVSEACYIPAALALIADYHRTTTRSLAIGVHMTGIMVGSGLGGLGGWIAERHGWAHAFTIFGLVGVAYAVLVACLLRDAPAGSGTAGPVRPEPGDGVRLGEALASLLSRPAFLLALGFWGLLGLAGWAFIGWLPTYLNEQFKLSQGAAGLSATGYLQAASLVGVLLGGVLADRWSRTNPRAPIHITVIGLCIAAPGVLLAAKAGALPLAIAGVMLYGLTKPFADANMMPILSLVADPRYRATGYGVLNLFSCTVGGLTVYLGGALRDAKVDVSGIFVFGALGLLISAAFLFFVRPRPAAAG
jgi:predicted MFS family arabinose efflux permease